MYRRYFENKIEGYKNQDRDKGREIDEDDYVDVDWCWRGTMGTVRSVILGLILKSKMEG